MKELTTIAKTGPPIYKNIDITIVSKGGEFPLIDIWESGTEKMVGVIRANAENTAYCFWGNGSWSTSSGVLRDIARLLDGMNIDGEIRV